MCSPSRPPVEALEPRQLLAAGDFTGVFAVNVNFQPIDLGPVAETRADFGRPFATRGNGLTYGWNRRLSPIDHDSTRDLPGLTVGGKLGNGPAGEDQTVDQRYDTNVPVNAGDSWSISVPELPAGQTYALSFVTGGPGFDGPYGAAKHDWLVNGTRVMTAVVTADYPWGENVIYADPVDGRITLTAGDQSAQNSLAWLRLASVESLPTAAPGRAVSWTNDTSLNSPIRRVEGGSATVGDRLYVLGGFTENYAGVTQRLDVYDFTTGQWSRGADLPGGETEQATAADGRYVYSVGGQLGPGNGDQHPGTAAAWRYDTTTDVWDRLPDLPAIRFGASAAVTDGFLYVFGGDEANFIEARGDGWKLDLTDPAATWRPVATMPFAVDFAEAVVLGGKIYVPGGEYAHAVSYVQRAELQIYDPAADSWSLGAPMPVPSSHARAVAYDGQIWVLGGQKFDQIVLSQVVSYDPATDRWLRHDDLPQTRKFGYPAVRGDRFYYFAGDGYGNGFPTSTLVGTLDAPA